MSTRNDKLKDLQEHTPTIFAPNCWGTFTYHHLGLEFRSPLITMFINHDEYLRFLSDPKYYMSQELKLKEMYIDENYEKPFPVGMLGDDVSLWMNHYKSFQEAKECWERRKKRIDWDNLFVMFWDEKPENVKKFMSLPFERKICMVPYETDEPGVISVPYREKEELKKYPFWEMVNNIALGKFALYDEVELLHDGKFVKVGNLERK